MAEHAKETNNDWRAMPAVREFLHGLSLVMLLCHETARSSGFEDEPEDKRLATAYLDQLEEYGVIAKDGSWAGTPQMDEVAGMKLAQAVLARATNNIGESIALMHSELSELLEAERSIGSKELATGRLADGECTSEKIPGFTNSEEEAADLLIRLLHTSSREGWRLGEATLAKMEYNRHRPRMHGRKF